MKNIKVKPFAFFIFGLFAVCFIAVALATGVEVRDVWSALKIAYKTVPILLIVWMVFVLHAWKWRIFRNWLVPFPHLLTSKWVGIMGVKMALGKRWMNFNSSAGKIQHRDGRVGRVESEGSTSRFPCASSVLRRLENID